MFENVQDWLSIAANLSTILALPVSVAALVMARAALRRHYRSQERDERLELGKWLKWTRSSRDIDDRRS